MQARAETNPAPGATVGPGRAGRATDPLLTADEVAASLRVTKGWIYAETRAGRIPHVRLGRYVRYRRSAIEGWLEALEQSPPHPVLAPPPSRRRPARASSRLR